MRTGTDICPLSFWREVGEGREVNLLAKQVKRMKKCTSCGEEKEFAEFYKSQSELYILFALLLLVAIIVAGYFTLFK